MNAVSPARFEAVLFAAWLAVLVWAPLPFASNRDWSAALLALLVALPTCAWLGLFLAGRVALQPQVWRYGRAPLALLLLVQGWVLLQTLPLPPALVAWLSPLAARWHLGEGWLTLSLDPSATRHYLLRGAALCAGFFLTLALVNSAQRVRWLLAALLFSGTLQAAYGAFMVLSGLELGFFVEKYVGQGVATGTFVNRNHLAGYLVLTLAAGTGLLLAQMDSRQSASGRERLRRWLRFLLSPTLRLRLFLAVMVIGLVLTRSRMGNAAFFLALAVAGAIALYSGRRFSWRIVAFLGSLLLVDLLILGQWFGFERLVGRFQEVAPGGDDRGLAFAYAADYVGAFPLTGSGAGSFYGIFPNFQAADLAGYYQHAHNDYLEFAAELGIPATLVLIAVVALALYRAVQAQQLRQTPVLRGAAFAVTMAVVWAAVHSLVDFNLQIPANALTFVTLLALAFVCRGLPSPARRDLS